MAKEKKRGRPPQPHAAYRNLATELRKRIISGEWAPGTVLPSHRAIADEYGVGRQVVWQALDALRREDRLAPNANKRLTVIEPVGGLTRTKGVLLEIVGDTLDHVVNQPYTREMQMGILKGAGELRLPLTIAHARNLQHTPAPPDLFDENLAGVLIVLNLREKALRCYRDLNVPVVLVDRPNERLSMHSASVDNENAAADATSRLIELGHRRIAFIRYASPGMRGMDPDSKERQAGFLRAMKSAGLKAADRALFTATSQVKAGSSMLRELLRRRPRFTAILAVNAHIARAVEGTTRELGLTVPRDLSIACFQEKSTRFEHFSGPRIDFVELARRATHLIRKPKLPTVRDRVPTDWAEGKTVGPCGSR